MPTRPMNFRKIRTAINVSIAALAVLSVLAFAAL
jgi:hypothetical protein